MHHSRLLHSIASICLLQLNQTNPKLLREEWTLKLQMNLLGAFQIVFKP